jgi:hypothetical protein
MIVMLQDIEECRNAGAAGVVFGVLEADGTVDIGKLTRSVHTREVHRERTDAISRLVEASSGLEGALSSLRSELCLTM